MRLRCPPIDTERTAVRPGLPGDTAAKRPCELGGEGTGRMKSGEGRNPSFVRRPHLPIDAASPRSPGRLVAGGFYLCPIRGHDHIGVIGVCVLVTAAARMRRRRWPEGRSARSRSLSRIVHALEQGRPARILMQFLQRRIDLDRHNRVALVNSLRQNPERFVVIRQGHIALAGTLRVLADRCCGRPPAVPVRPPRLRCESLRQSCVPSRFAV